MHSHSLAVFSTLVLVVSPTVAAEPKSVESKILSVGLFKNGVAVVKRTVTFPADGEYEVTDVPDAVHGTFWIESNAEIEARVTQREVQDPLGSNPSPDLRDELAGKDVTVHFRDGSIPAVTGRVVEATTRSGSDAWSRRYEQRPRSYWWAGLEPASPSGVSRAPSPFLVVQQGEGPVYIDRSTIAYVSVRGGGATATRRRPVLVLRARGTEGEPALATISYLTKGLAWAPSYRVDVTDPKTLTVEQKAVIRNELGAVEDAEVELISGFPNVEFSHVLSPLSPRTGWASFFQQLSRQLASGSSGIGQVTSQLLVTTNRADSSRDVSTTDVAAGDGVDLYYHKIGKRSLEEGDTLALSTGRGTASYERIVEWIVPDTRSADGRYVQGWERQRNAAEYDDAPWDALRFKNPLGFPMTTGPAVITEGGRFYGERMSTWIAPGEETTLRVTKALSVRTRHVELEEEGERGIVYIGGRKFRRATVRGELFLYNLRQEPAKTVIRRRFSGELREADGDPKSRLREEGVYSVNPRYELSWTLTLLPGEKKTLKYRYSVLVAH